MMPEHTTDRSVPAAGSSSAARWRRRLFAVGLAVALLVVVLPTLASKSGMLASLLNARLSPHGIQASIGRTQLGWFTPTSFRQVQLADARNGWNVDVAELRSELSLWRLFTSRGDLGTFTIEQPTIVVTVDESFSFPPLDARDEQTEPADPTKLPSRQRFQIDVRNGTILVRVPNRESPLEFAREINLRASWQKSADERVLSIEPGMPLKRVQLTPEMCDTGLKFVAPIFSDVTWSQGSLSLELDECRIPLDQPAQAVVRGRVSLHSVETGLRNPLAREIATVVAQVTRRDLPDSVKLADESVIEFQVQDARAHHSGLEFGLPKLAPELVIRTRGNVGFDGSLDLLAELPLPMARLGDGPVLQALGNQTLNLPIRGTLDEPHLAMEGDGQVASDIIAKLLDPVVSGEVTAEDLIKSLQNLRQQRQERREQRLEQREQRGPLFPRLRNR